MLTFGVIVPPVPCGINIMHNMTFKGYMLHVNRLVLKGDKYVNFGYDFGGNIKLGLVILCQV